jgi:hypothetical protein
MAKPDVSPEDQDALEEIAAEWAILEARRRQLSRERAIILARNLERGVGASALARVARVARGTVYAAQEEAA